MKTSKFTSLALVIIMTLTLLAPAAQAKEKTTPLLASFPSLALVVSMDLPGFKEVENQDVLENGLKARLTQFLNLETSVFVTVIVTEGMKKISSSQCRDFYYADAKAAMGQGVQKAIRKGKALISYLGYYPDTGLAYRSVNGYLSKEGACVDVHITKEGYVPEEEAELMSIIDSAKIQKTVSDISAKTKTANDYFLLGSVAYYNNDFSQAITMFEKALLLEKTKTTLDKNTWRILVDNLGMAYGISKNYAKAESTFKYGLSKDPQYPMFFYNLACTYAETGKTNDTIINLEKTYQYKANMISGEKIPDPFTDPSFKSMLDNKEFQNIAKKIQDYQKTFIFDSLYLI